MIYEGHIEKIHDAGEIDQHQVGLLMAGSSADQARGSDPTPPSGRPTGPTRGTS